MFEIVDRQAILRDAHGNDCTGEIAKLSDGRVVARSLRRHVLAVPFFQYGTLAGDEIGEPRRVYNWEEIPTECWPERYLAVKAKLKSDPCGFLNFGPRTRSSVLAFVNKFPDVSAVLGLPSSEPPPQLFCSGPTIAPVPEVGAAAMSYYNAINLHLAGRSGELDHDRTLIPASPEEAFLHGSSLLSVGRSNEVSRLQGAGVIRSKFGCIHVMTLVLKEGPFTWVEVDGDHKAT